MIALSQLFFGFFKTREPIVTDVQTPLEPVHEDNAVEGSEFLDDFVKMDEEEGSEPK